MLGRWLRPARCCPAVGRAARYACHDEEPDELELAFPLFVCEHHQANPQSTAPEMIALEHERLKVAVTVLGYDAPKFETARLTYDPLPPMPRKGAH